MVELRKEEAEGPVVKGWTAEGAYRIGNRVVPGGLLLTPDNAFDWEPPAIDALTIEDFGQLLALDPLPEFIVLGTGADLAHPPRALVRALEERGIGLDPMDSRAAARAWSLLRAEERWAAAALMPLNR